ncbi:MAG: D-tyrosyl-tRNA(Tyr) deacylase [Clostridiales bacterium]|nr:D-tyrosyl-tRNA(Tyr) deacylase [Clostridiales bacterium]
MRAVIQRVKGSSVAIDGQTVGQCGHGLMVLIGVEAGDTEKDMAYIADKVPNLRIFEDDNGKMNLSLMDMGGQILAISQFTLLGDARGGRRPSFTAAARPDTAVPLYEALVEKWRGLGIHVETGVFGADMQVSLVNDGPVTILLDSHKLF